jgi:UDP-4-amino-4,6-dideoxy-N-acetyl-beta-L-altrosamine N-acetyltransferase
MSEKYKIRKMMELDLEQVLLWRNSDKIRASMYTDQVITWKQHTAWFEHIQQNHSAVFLIFECDDVPSGVVSFVQLDQRNSKCNWGFYLGREDLPKGSGTTMGRLGLKYAFEELNMRKVCGEAFAFNIASIKLHEKLGFQTEGKYKEHILKNENYEDIVLFGLLKKDFESRGWFNE